MKITNENSAKLNKQDQEEALYLLANLLIDKYLQDKASKAKEKMVSLDNK